MNLKHIAKDMNEAFKLSMLNPGEEVHYPGGALCFAVQLMDCGAKIGVGIEHNGKRKAVCFENPAWEELSADWQHNHPA